MRGSGHSYKCEMANDLFNNEVNVLLGPRLLGRHPHSLGLVTLHLPLMLSHARLSYTWRFIKGTFHNYDLDADNVTAVVELAHVPRSLAGKCRRQTKAQGGYNCKQCPEGGSGRKLSANGECMCLGHEALRKV